MVALSFASNAETNAFYKTATTTATNRTKRRHGKGNRQHSNEQLYLLSETNFNLFYLLSRSTKPKVLTEPTDH